MRFYCKCNIFYGGPHEIQHGLNRQAWICSDTHGYAWIFVCMDIHGYALICMDMHGYAWICMDMHGYARICDDIGVCEKTRSFYWRAQWL